MPQQTEGKREKERQRDRVGKDADLIRSCVTMCARGIFNHPLSVDIAANVKNDAIFAVGYRWNSRFAERIKSLMVEIS